MRAAIVGLLICFCCYHVEFFGQWRNSPALHETFDSEQPSWEILSMDSSGVALDRARVSDVAVSGKSETYQCEFVHSGIYFVGHSILLPYLIDDLNIGIWVRSQETGVICALEVVLPKSTDPDGKPITLLLPGDKYTNRGEWQRLRVKANLRELEQQTEKLRLELEVPIDTSQAYVRRLVLCCYAAGKTSRVWLDDLQADGITTISQRLRERYEAEPVFNPKNILWLFSQLGLYQTSTASINVDIEPTSIASENWTSQKKPQLPTISHYDPPAQRFVPQDTTLQQTQNFQRPYLQQPVGGFPSAPNSQTLLLPDNPIMLVSGNNSAAVFYPNDGNATSANPMSGTPGRTAIVPSSPASTPTSPLSSQLFDQPELYRHDGEFPEHILEDRINRGKPHDGCQIAAQSKMLWINGNLPLGVRAIEYNGEPLKFLVSLQFNTIWLRQAPTEALLEEAWKLGIWVICPPPDNNETLRQFIAFLNTTGMTEDGKNKANGSSLGVLGRMFARNRNPILAWDMGHNLTHGEIEQVQQRVQLVRDADIYHRRIPFLCSAESGARDYSRVVDIMLTNRNPILSSLEWNDYNTWLGTKTNWPRPGTPNWCTIQTQPTTAMAHQWRLFGVGEIPATAVSEEQVRQQIRLAMANECHGLLFSSNSRLDAGDAETQYRVAVLELVNMEMMLIDGWFSQGNSPKFVPSRNPEVSGILLETTRAKLLLPHITKPFGQYVMGNTNCNDVAFLMPGNFETYQANHLMPGGTRPLTLQRVTGGVQVHFDEVNTTTAAFFAQAEPIMRAVIPRSRHPELSRRSAELAITLAKMRLDQVRKTIRAFQEIQALPGGLPLLGDHLPIITMPEQDSMLRETEQSISTAESYYQQADYSSSYLQAHRSIAGLQFYERLKWEEAIRKVPHHNMIPTSVSFVTLPAYIETVKKMWGAKPGENRLLAGDGENAAVWQQSGWRSLNVPTEGVIPGITVANSAAARSGQGGIQLRLISTSQIATTTPSMGGGTVGETTLISGSTSESDSIPLETAPVWITTPQIPVYAGETLCITGYVNIPQRLKGNVDGFMIFDSLGGESLALRWTDTGGQWQQFTLYRAVPSAVPPNATMCVTFALGGLGEVLLDDLQIFPIIFDPNAPPPSQPQPPGSTWPQIPRLDQLLWNR